MFRLMIAVSVIIFVPVLKHALSQEGEIQQRVDELVEQLASKNPVPREVKGSSAEYPTAYDDNLQKLVYQVYRELDALGVTAFPDLIKHFDDKRYSLTADAGPMDKNFTVGELCYYIVELQIQPDKGWTVGTGDPRFRKFRPHFPREIKLRDKAAAMNWWEQNKDKSLTDIQIAVTEWTIAEEEKASVDFSDDEKAALAKRLRDLRSTGKPFPSTVPWVK